MRGNHHRLRLYVANMVLELHSTGPQLVQDTLIVHQVAQNRNWLFGALLLSETNGVPDAETHTEMSGTNDLHKRTTRSGLAEGWWFNFLILCNTK